jgi:3-oxoacyl-(acyl-carrier-protein) synthase
MQILASGMISPLGCTEADYWQSLCDTSGSVPAQRAEVRCHLPRARARRISRFGWLTIEAVAACQEAGEPFDERVGTVFTSAYAELASNLSFARDVSEADPDMCSPTVFSNTVANASLGNTCIEYQLKGPSTMLLGSNPFVLAQALLDAGKADRILCGGMEEYSPDLDDSLRQSQGGLPDVRECAVVLSVGAGDGAGVVIDPPRLANLAFCPYTHPFPIQALPRLERLVGAAFDDVDVVLADAGTTLLGKEERRVCPAPVLEGFDAIVGHALGADLTQKVYLADLILRRGEVPEGLARGAYRGTPQAVGILSTEVTGGVSLMTVRRAGKP